MGIKIDGEREVKLLLLTMSNIISHSYKIVSLINFYFFLFMMSGS